MITWCACGKAIDDAVWEAMPLVGIMTPDGDPIPEPPNMADLRPGCLVLKNCSCRSTISRESADPIPGTEVDWPMGGLRLPPLPGVYQWRAVLDDRVRDRDPMPEVDPSIPGWASDRWGEPPPAMPEDPDAHRCMPRESLGRSAVWSVHDEPPPPMVLTGFPEIKVTIDKAPKRYTEWDKASGQEMLRQLEGFRSALMGGKQMPAMMRELGYSDEQTREQYAEWKKQWPAYTLDELAAAQEAARPLQASFDKALKAAREKEEKDHLEAHLAALAKDVMADAMGDKDEETPSWRARHGWPEPKPAACSCGCDEHAMLSGVDCPKCGHWIPKDSDFCKENGCTEWALSESPWCRNHLPDEEGK